MSDQGKPLHVVELRAENVMRLRAVTIRPNGTMVLIGGRNAQGKTSVISSIEMALSGARAIPQEPVHHGARKARIVVDLGEIVVERTFSAKGTQLVVRGADGVEVASPQKLLDTLCSKIAFDPLEFARMEPKKQDELLKRMLGLDFSDLEAARDKAFAQRTDANREVKRLDTLLDDTEHHVDAPKEPVSVADLTAELQRRTDALTARTIALQEVDSRKRELARGEEELQRLLRQVRELEAKNQALVTAIEEATNAVPTEPAPLAAIHEQLKNAEAVNAKVRANAERAKLEAQLKKKTAEVEQLTGAIESIDAEKAERLAKAKFPIPGLGFDDSGPTLNGVPLAQASQAERLRLSVAIGAAMNPRIKVMLVREGAFLDEDGLALLAQLAEETGSQIIVERVGSKDPGAIVIEDGMVLGDEPSESEETPIAAAG